MDSMCLHCAAHTSCSQEEVGSANWALQRREAERHALTFGWFMGAMGCERHHRDRCCHAPVRVLCTLQKQSPPPGLLCASHASLHWGLQSSSVCGCGAALQKEQSCSGATARSWGSGCEISPARDVSCAMLLPAAWALAKG